LKRSELRKLVAEYKDIRRKLSKSDNKKHVEKLKEIRHRYFHETGQEIEYHKEKFG
jgi:uncharacterized membrane protein (DUF106 family)